MVGSDGRGKHEFVAAATAGLSALSKLPNLSVVSAVKVMGTLPELTRTT